jgi:hypothetical protein
MESDKPFTETIEILAELKDEFILLESIRQCAKELFLAYKKHGLNQAAFYDKFNELEHLVNAD